MSRVVCWPGGGALLLDHVVRNSDGSIKSGLVVNGRWKFVVKDDECLAKSGNHIVTRWQKPESIPEVAVSPEHHGEYNEIIAWAERQRK